MTLVIAHRGASRDETENTVAAFARAVAVGADAVELDVRRTADHRLVVHHDAALADGRPIVQLRRRELPGHVPTLAAALDACGDLLVNVEIKNDPRDPDHDPSDWVVQRLAAELSGGLERVLVSSFRPPTVERAHRLGFATAQLVVASDRATVGAVAAGGHRAIHPEVGLLDEQTVRAAHGLGLAVNAWTCDDPARIAELIAWGVDGICTNVPDVALAVRRSVAGASG